MGDPQTQRLFKHETVSSGCTTVPKHLNVGPSLESSVASLGYDSNNSQMHAHVEHLVAMHLLANARPELSEIASTQKNAAHRCRYS